VKAYAAEAPETALAWAETISDKAQRSSLCAVAAARWLSKDPERAEAWIRTAPVLSDAQRAAILEAHRIIPEPVIDRE
jgi:ferric-dicitrate binding protein FerR (iron transport regulator)